MPLRAPCPGRLPLPDGGGQVGHRLCRPDADRLEGDAARVHTLDEAYDHGRDRSGRRPPRCAPSRAQG